MRVKITNNSQAQQGVHTVDGLAWLRRGQTRTLDLTEDGLARAQRLPFLKVEVLADDLHDQALDGETQHVGRLSERVEIEGEIIADAPLAGSGEAIQQPTVDAETDEPIPPVQREAFDPELADAMTDDELRAYITERDGKAPHHKLGHDKLVELAKTAPEA